MEIRARIRRRGGRAGGARRTRLGHPLAVSRVLLAYAVSGFVSLGYQVAWFRVVTDWFGSTNATFALVVTNFIGGLALGALASRRTSDRLVRLPGMGEGLRVYGLVELLVAASILLTFVVGWLPADLWSSFPYVERDGIWVPTPAYRFVQIVTAAACVFVPCFFMGVTFPLLCDRFRAHPRGARFPAALYAANTLGACGGVLACQFVFLPSIGHAATLGLMAAANALLGGAFLASRSEFGRVAPSRSIADLPADPARRAATPAALLALVSVGGFLSGALEGDLFKRISFVIELNPGATMSFISFWAILAIFLASATMQRAGQLRIRSIQLAFAAAALYCFATWHAIDAIRDFVEARVLPAPVEVAMSLEGMRNLQFPTGLLQLWVFVGILVFPPYYLVSLLLPAVCNQLQGERCHLGPAYGLNTLAFCVGFLGFVLIVPRVNLFYSFKLFSLVFALGAAWLLLLWDTRRLPLWKPLVLLGAVATAALAVPADFDRGFFRPGSLPATQPVRAVKSNGAHTTFVLDVRGAPRLFFGRLQMSASNVRARTYMRLMAHFPLLLHANPQRALLICLGVGNTGAAIALHESIRQIDVVDLNHRVFETAPELSSVHGGLHRDPRVRFIHDDGRNFLNLTDQRYDLITSEPPPPLAAGVYRLYSREYYRKARERLTPNGFMTQWLPLFLMTPEAVERAVSSFIEVFPHAFLFTGYGTDFVLVGSPSPIEMEGFERRFRASRKVREELFLLNITTPESLLARIVQSGVGLRRNYAAAPPIRDQHNDLEQLFPDPLKRPVVAYEPEDVLAYLEQRVPQLYPRAEGILSHLGRLRFHVQGYPFETLAAVDPERSPGIALAGADWLALSRLYLKTVAAARARRPDQSMRVLERFLEVEAELPEVQLLLARMKLQRGRTEEAISLLRAFLALEPDAFLGRQLLASAFQRAGRPAEALAEYREAARLMPDAPGPLLAMASIHAGDSDPEVRDAARAVQLAEQAAQLAPTGNPAVAEVLAAAYAGDGRFERAVEVLQGAIDALPDERNGERRRLEGRLARYREGGG